MVKCVGDQRPICKNNRHVLYVDVVKSKFQSLLPAQCSGSSIMFHTEQICQSTLAEYEQNLQQTRWKKTKTFNVLKSRTKQRVFKDIKDIKDKGYSKIWLLTRQKNIDKGMYSGLRRVLVYTELICTLTLVVLSQHNLPVHSNHCLVDKLSCHSLMCLWFCRRSEYQ